MTNNTLILGVGNVLRQDDGVGSKVIAILQQENLSHVDLMDGGISDSLTLLDKISNYQQVIIIDALNMNAKPGTSKSFTPQEAIINIQSDTLSTHGFGLAELINLMQQLEIKTQLHIIGIQPQNIAFGEELTPIITNQVPNIIVAIKYQLACVMPSQQD